MLSIYEKNIHKILNKADHQRGTESLSSSSSSLIQPEQQEGVFPPCSLNMHTTTTWTHIKHKHMCSDDIVAENVH